MAIVVANEKADHDARTNKSHADLTALFMDITPGEGGN
jgi:hypothetical protein